MLLARLIDRVMESLSSNLSLDNPTCYTDSKVAFYWIVGEDKQWKQFVQNRVSEIRELLPVTCWRHCPGVDNPADIPSRGLTPIELSTNKLWHCGPDWLLRRPDEGSAGIEMPEDCLVEMRTTGRNVHTLLSGSSTVSLGSVIQCQDYSSLRRLLTVTAYVLKFVHTLKEAVKKNCNSGGLSIDAQDLSKAEMMWLRESQQQLVKDSHFPIWTKQFGLYSDEEGIWRCGGRLDRADISPAAKHPIILPRGHHLTALIVRRAHERVCHNGIKETLTEVRARFWIIKGRSLVRKLIHQCTICRRYEGPHYQVPPPPPLPEFRVSEQPPFTFTGVDFAGPLYIRYPGSKETCKVWICLFTCCVIRAVHLDLVPNMTTTAFMRCFKRFVSRKGFPRRIISDNGRTFKCAAKELRALLKQREVQQYLACNQIKWTFNVERAPWWGGVFERLVKSTKRCLRKVVGRARLFYDELSTVLTEIEAVINCRPLTYISAEDLDEPLTPSHFLYGRRIQNLPDGLSEEHGEEEFAVAQPCLSKRLRHLNATLNQFWKRWRGEYLLELRDAHRRHGGRLDAIPPSVGDIVLVEDEGKPRGLWQLARVSSLITGRDGHPRGAVLHVPSSGSQGTLQRPLQHLFPIEVVDRPAQPRGSRQSDPVPDPPENAPEMDPGPGTDVDETVSTRVRPRRSAASEARDKLAACALIERDPCAIVRIELCT